MSRALHQAVVRRAARGHGLAPAFAVGRFADRQDRWPALVEALSALRLAGRCSVRIVDADCGRGDFLLGAAVEARRQGFCAVEAYGIDGSPALIAEARQQGDRLHDPAIGCTFARRDLREMLAEEAAFPADLLLWPGRLDERWAEAAQAAATRVIAAPAGDASR